VAATEVELWGGKGANQAVNAAALLAGVTLVGSVGDDERGAGALEALSRAGVDRSFVVTQAAPTGIATIVVDEAGENTIVLSAGANALLSARHVRDTVRAAASPETIVVASLEVPIEAVTAVAGAAREAGARFVLNPAPARPVGSTPAA